MTPEPLADDHVAGERARILQVRRDADEALGRVVQERVMAEARRIRESCLSEDCVDVEPLIADALLEAEARGNEWWSSDYRMEERLPSGRVVYLTDPYDGKMARAAELRAQKGGS